MSRYSIVLKRPWEHHEVYARAEKWVNDTLSRNIRDNRTQYGISYINGSVYVSNIVFDNQEEALVFKLSFPEIAL